MGSFCSMGGFCASFLTQDVLRLCFCPSKVRAQRARAEALCLLADLSAHTDKCNFTYEEATKSSIFISFMTKLHYDLSKVQYQWEDLSKELFVHLMLYGKLRP